MKAAKLFGSKGARFAETSPPALVEIDEYFPSFFKLFARFDAMQFRPGRSEDARIESPQLLAMGFGMLPQIRFPIGGKLDSPAAMGRSTLNVVAPNRQGVGQFPHRGIVFVDAIPVKQVPFQRWFIAQQIGDGIGHKGFVLSSAKHGQIVTTNFARSQRAKNMAMRGGAFEIERCDANQAILVVEHNGREELTLPSIMTPPTVQPFASTKGDAPRQGVPFHLDVVQLLEGRQ